MAILNRINKWLSILTASTDGRLDCNEFGLKEDRSDAHWRGSNFEESIFSSLQALSFNYGLKTDLTSCLIFILSHNILTEVISPFIEIWISRGACKRPLADVTVPEPIDI